MGENKNKKKSKKITKEDIASDLLDRWKDLRQQRILNQVAIFNYSIPNSSQIYSQYYKFHNGIKRCDLKYSIDILTELQEWAEDWLKSHYIILERIAGIKKIFSPKDFKHIQSSLEQEKGYLIDALRTFAEDKSTNLYPFYEKIIDWIEYGSNININDIFKTEIKQSTKLAKEYLNELGGVAARSLYAKTCLEVLYRREEGNSSELEIKDTDKLLKMLWEEMRKENIEKCIILAKQLKEDAEGNCLRFAYQISDLRFKRINLDDNNEKMKLLIKEYENVKKMKLNGFYYAIGLYFYTLFESNLAHRFKKEVKKALDLKYESKNPFIKTTINELLEHLNEYDGKEVTVTGLVSEIKETKLKKGKGEIVFTTFKLSQDERSIELYFPRNWLTDNGLVEEGYSEFTGIFNKKCSQSKEPDIHVIRQGFGKRKKNDWLSYCRWLVRDWWDGFSGRAIADWSFDRLNPVSLLPPGDMDDTFENLKRDFPPIRATLRSFKSLIFDHVREKIGTKFAVFLHSLYLQHTFIDTIIFLSLIAELRGSFQFSLPTIRWYKESIQETTLDLSEIVKSRYETEVLESGINLNWLIHEFKAFLTEFQMTSEGDR